MAKKDDFNGQAGPDTIIGSNVKIKGNLVSEGDVTIDGVMNGNVKAGGNIMLGSNGRISGNLIGHGITIAGSITGSIAASEDTTITATGEVIGDITTNTLQIDRGALFNGVSKMKQAASRPPEEEE